MLPFIVNRNFCKLFTFYFQLTNLHEPASSRACHEAYFSSFNYRSANQNHGKNICRLFQILAQFPFTINERELDYYHQKVNEYASCLLRRRTTEDLKS